MSLAQRSALVIGTGGLSGPAALGLAAAGLGSITLLDDDLVDATNLGRQILFGDADVGKQKAPTAAAALQARFPAVRVTPQVARFVGQPEQIAGHDIVLDGSDNFVTRFAANDACVELSVPLVHGAAIGWQGQLLTILPGETPCLRCIFESEPPTGTAPTCAAAGVFSPLVGLVGSWMAEAAVEVLSGGRPETAGAVRVYDAWHGRRRLAPLGRDPECRACGRNGNQRAVPTNRESPGGERHLSAR